MPRNDLCLEQVATFVFDEARACPDLRVLPRESSRFDLLERELATFTFFRRAGLDLHQQGRAGIPRAFGACRHPTTERGGRCVARGSRSAPCPSRVLIRVRAHAREDGFIAAAFRDRTSRAVDPQLHTHVLAANAARGIDRHWSALDGHLLYRYAKTGGYLYQAHFAP